MNPELSAKESVSTWLEEGKCKGQGTLRSDGKGAS